MFGRRVREGRRRGRRAACPPSPRARWARPARPCRAARACPRRRRPPRPRPRRGTGVACAPWAHSSTPLRRARPPLLCAVVLMRPPTSSKGLTRRRFIGGASASFAGAALLGAAGCKTDSGSDSERMNVLLVIVDSVRSDFVSAYGAPRVRTPNMDALAASGLRFTRFFPEAMPTVPARRTIMTGRRVFPFRGWERAPDLGRGPGAAPIEDLASSSPRAWHAPATGPPRRATTRSSASRARSAPSGCPSTPTSRSRATAASAATPSR